MFRKQTYAFLITLCFVGLTLPGRTQTSISGTVNTYIDVVSVDAADQITVSDASQFIIGDTVLIIQMKGIEINVPTTAAAYGSLQNKFSSGKYEFLIISNISGNQIVFSADLAFSYDINGMVQLVRVPGYDNAVVSGELTCDPWDQASGYGGVIALIVGNTLSLNADINASEAGFRGAAISTGDGICAWNDVAYEYAFFNAASDSAGFKGEGATSYSSPGTLPLSVAYAKGRGANFNGGGGGNAVMAGGGGGGNIGTGGLGGVEADSCLPPKNTGGLGGKSIDGGTNWDIESRIYLGGGGGTGTQFGPYTATPGGHGGGIVIIIADTVVGNNYSIKANGQNVLGIANASGGGGGAGGTVLLNVTGYKTNLNVEAEGGKGGDTNDGAGYCTGAGGGGGGGLLWHANPTLPANVVATLNGGVLGDAGPVCVLNNGTSGGDGRTEANLVVPLTGFLFNAIYSSVTSVRTDTICEGDIAPPLRGTYPKGGTPPYDFEWDSSTDKVVWTWEAQGPTYQNYAPSASLVDTTYYRRTVYDNSIPQIVDVSKVITIIVQPRIVNNVMAVDDTVCSGIQPDTLFATPKLPSGGSGPGSYSYIWEESTDGGTNWAPLAGAVDPSYEPPVRNEVAITEYRYRRIVRSGIGCPDTSNAALLTYLPVLANAIAADQEICDGQDPALLTNVSVSGGTGIWNYSWQESTDGVNYGAGLATTQTYDPLPISHGTALTEHRYYRRTVTSSVCADSSAVADITVYPLISNNTIVSDQTICKNTPAAQLTGAVYGGGDGTYAFEWIKSDDGGTSYLTTGITTEFYDPGNLSIPHHFKRVITSNACTDTSTAPVFIDIHPVFNATISDLAAGTDTICNGGTGRVEISVDFAGGADWTLSLIDEQSTVYPDVTFGTSPYLANVLVDVAMTGSAGDATRTLSVNAISDQWGCQAETIIGSGRIVTQRPPVADPGIGDPVCGMTITLGAVPPWSNSESSGLWSAPPGIVFSNPGSASSGVTVPAEGLHTLTWTVFNGKCPQDQADLPIQFWEPPSPAVIIKPSASDTTLEAFANTLDLQARAVIVGTKEWSSPGIAVFSPVDAEFTTASNLDWGNNQVQFKVSNGTCPDEIAAVTIIVQEDPFISQGISPRVSIGQNDFFRVKNIGNVPNELTVFSRTGNTVFRTENFMTASNFPDGWDGTDMQGNPLPDDTYYYVLNVKGGFARTFTGYIVIKGGQ